MSIRSWWNEFSPRKCTKVRKAEAVASMRKMFIGCRPENLAKHGLRIESLRLYDLHDPKPVSKQESVFEVSCKNNALCVHYLYPGACKDCPVVKRTGNFCDKGKDSPYESLIRTKDPARWIAVLAPREIF